MTDHPRARHAAVAALALLAILAAWAPLARSAPPPPLTTTDDVQRAIRYAWADAGVQAQYRALAVAQCESRFKQRAMNPHSGALGVYQFLPSTWSTLNWWTDHRDGSRHPGPWNLWRLRDPLDARWNIRAAKRLWLISGRTFATQWTCGR